MKITIIHSWQDKSVATKLLEDLKKDGHTVWINIMQLLSGDSKQNKIDEEISNSDVIVVLWSKSALNSQKVYAEIKTASNLKKRIIPMQLDNTPITDNAHLNGLLGIPVANYEIGSLLLRRALVILMASEMGQKMNLVDQAIGNISDLGGFLNYVNTYRLQNDQNDDGYNTDWINRLTDLFQQNDQIRTTETPKSQNTMKEMEAIVVKLEHGNATQEQLKTWLTWCDKNHDLYPSMIKKLRKLIIKDISYFGEESPNKTVDYSDPNPLLTGHAGEIKRFEKKTSGENAQEDLDLHEVNIQNFYFLEEIGISHCKLAFINKSLGNNQIGYEHFLKWKKIISVLTKNFPNVRKYKKWQEFEYDQNLILLIDIDDKFIDTKYSPSGKQDTRDQVNCTIFSPPITKCGESLLVQVFVHLVNKSNEAEELAKEFDEDAVRRGFTSLNTEIERGSKLTFELSFRNIQLEEPVQTLIWNGLTESVAFEVNIPDNCIKGILIGKVVISQHSIPLGHISFKIKVLAKKSSLKKPQGTIPTGEAKHYKNAFISYASQDRSEVLRRVQMLSATRIKYFQDIFNLEPGDIWSEKIYNYINDADVFFLFWSNAASKSDWVLKEIRYALNKKAGDDYNPPEIIPILIENPMPSPPDELKHIHFNDKFIYFIGPN